MSSVKSERLDLRLAPSNKRLLQEAAVSLGVNVTEFVTAAAINAARRIKDEDAVRILSAQDTARFLRVLDETEPNAALKAAYKTVQQQR